MAEENKPMTGEELENYSYSKHIITRAILRMFRSSNEMVSMEDCGDGYWRFSLTFDRETVIYGAMEKLMDGGVEAMKLRHDLDELEKSEKSPVPDQHDPMQAARTMVFAMNKAQHDEKAKNSTGEQRE